MNDQTSMRILVIKTSSLGDLFHAYPAVDLMARHFGADIHWVTNPPYRELVEQFPGVSRVIPFPRHSFARDGQSFVRALRQERYDLILDFQGLLKSAMIAMLARGARRIGCSFCREGTRYLYREVAGPMNKQRHAVEECLDTVRYLEIPVHCDPEPIRFPEGPVELNLPAAALVPVSRWRAKDWPTGHAAAFAHRLHQETGMTVYLLGGLREQAACAAVAEQAGDGVINLAGKTGIVEMGGVLQHMALTVSVDSGPMHMSAAAGVPTLGLFGLTDPQRTGPWGAHCRTVSPPDLPHRPRAFKSDEPWAMAYMQAITPDAVMDTAKRMLG